MPHSPSQPSGPLSAVREQLLDLLPHITRWRISLHLPTPCPECGEPSSLTVGPRDQYLVAVLVCPNCGEQASYVTTEEHLRGEPPSWSVLARGPVARALQEQLQSVPSPATPIRRSR